ncbi:hypothetical protein IMG5_102050, partial [Ichthyophthirius multifiliis]
MFYDQTNQIFYYQRFNFQKNYIIILNYLLKKIHIYFLYQISDQANIYNIYLIYLKDQLYFFLNQQLYILINYNKIKFEIQINCLKFINSFIQINQFFFFREKQIFFYKKKKKYILNKKQCIKNYKIKLKQEKQQQKLQYKIIFYLLKRQKVKIIIFFQFSKFAKYKNQNIYNFIFFLNNQNKQNERLKKYFFQIYLFSLQLNYSQIYFQFFQQKETITIISNFKIKYIIYIILYESIQLIVLIVYKTSSSLIQLARFRQFQNIIQYNYRQIYYKHQNKYIICIFIQIGVNIQFHGQYKFKRQDITLNNKQNLKLECSLFEPQLIIKNKESPDNSCVIYCHCNSGSRIEALQILPQLISKGIGLFCFDFSGSGISEGEYVTLGKNESEDLEIIVKYLKDQKKIDNLILWGRSMGAVASFLYLNKPGTMRNIKGVIFDSGFANLNFLAQEVANLKNGMPILIIETILSFISDKIKQKYGLDIKNIDLTKIIHNLHIPCYFLCSKEDTFIKCENTEQLFNRYNGPKQIQYVDGNHNAQRKEGDLIKILDWILKLLDDKQQTNSSSLLQKKYASIHQLNNPENLD